MKQETGCEKMAMKAGVKVTDDMFNQHHDHEWALRKTQEAAARRYQATRWLREMDRVACDTLLMEPSEEDFCSALRNGLILCNVLNKVHPGAIPKVVNNRVVAVQSIESGAQSAIQYFENMRNFLVAVGNMKLLTFEASDLEKGGSSSKVVDCILCLKGYHEWKQAGGIGVWRYGGTVRISSYPKDCSSSSVGSESADESSVDEYELSQYEQLSQFLHHSIKVSDEETKAAKSLSSLFDHFALRILQAYIIGRSDIDELPLNSMVIDTLIRKVVKDLSAMLVSQGIQFGMMLKKVAKSETTTLSKEEFLEAISQYLSQKTSMKTNDLCTCGGQIEKIQQEDTCPKDYKDVIHDQQKQLCELKSSFEETKQEVRKTHFEWDAEIKKLVTHVRSLEVASSSYYKVLEENRQLYNQVQDLKGAIRVYCRVRPFLSGNSDGKSTVDHIGEDGSLMIVHPHKQGRDARRIFSFNKVFGTNVTQQQIYADTQPLIRSVLDGYNVCIFAYGQTGSGKTYTMSGPDLTAEDTWGVNYRALTDLFQISKSRADMIEYEIGVQMIEIYNEQVRDLLVVDGSSRKLDIRNNSQLNGLNVPDACLVKVNCTQDVLELMKVGLKNRAVGATALNERSSRSHSILTIHVQGKELHSGSVLKGCLHLVDLAGSERIDKSEAVGERLKEAQHINKSLSALGDVIYALAQKSAHIPYRNSKLTQVLQDSLGGQAKTLMFVHINPETNAIGETFSTLKFAERVASIELGAARANKETSEIRDLKAEISNLKETVEKKEAELEHLKSANIRSNVEAQKVRAESPMHAPRIGRAIDDKTFEVKSCSSGKQRRSRLPFSCTENEAISRMPLIAEEKFSIAGNPRSPSPPVRRSMSTDRGTLIRSRLKPEVTEKLIAKPQLPVRISVNKSVAAASTAKPSVDGIIRGVSLFQETAGKQGNFSNVLSSLQRTNFKKVQPSQNDEQSNKVLSVRQVTVRKSKQENKPKIKNQLPSRVSKNDGFSLDSYSDAGGNVEEEAGKSDFSEPENDLFGSPVYSASKLKKTRQENSSRGELIASGKVESKIPTGTGHNPKESSNSMLELRRSRSTPRGKFFFFP